MFKKLFLKDCLILLAKRSQMRSNDMKAKQQCSEDSKSLALMYGGNYFLSTLKLSIALDKLEVNKK